MTKINCHITDCNHNTEFCCTQSNIRITMTAISGLPRYRTCISFESKAVYDAGVLTTNEDPVFPNTLRRGG